MKFPCLSYVLHTIKGSLVFSKSSKKMTQEIACPTLLLADKSLPDKSIINFCVDNMYLCHNLVFDKLIGTVNCEYIHTYVYIRMYICTHVQMCTHTYMYTHTHTCVRVCIHICV